MTAVADPAPRAVEVVRAGALTSVQDSGRRGYRHVAVGESGALDVAAHRLANRLVGNNESAAVLETTVDGCTLRFHTSAVVAVTGALCSITVGGAPVAWAAAHFVTAGQQLDVGRATAGVRAYVAVDGGLAVAPELGSRSFDALSGLGPAPLVAGDVLPLGTSPPVTPPAVDVVARRPPDGELTLDLWAGPRHDWLTPSAAPRLFSTPWTVASASNRVALRLDGPPLDRGLDRSVDVDGRHRELPSEGIVAGAVQVPPDGQPIVFLADHPTTGGYPVVGVAVAPGRWQCAQLRPGDVVRFRRAGPDWETAGAPPDRDPASRTHR